MFSDKSQSDADNPTTTEVQGISYTNAVKPGRLVCYLILALPLPML
jgi:hypothetical protein